MQAISMDTTRTRTRRPMPDGICNDVVLFHNGLSPLPQAFVMTHRKWALQRLDEYAEFYGVNVSGYAFMPETACAKMKVMFAELITQSGRNLTVKWDDARQDFQKLVGADWQCISESDLY